MPTNPNWSEEEDEALRRLVGEYGPKKWSLIASKLKSKGSKQCRRRWKNYLNADLKTGGWTAEEDRILIDGHRKYGNKWTEIAKLVGGRTDNAVKNRWAALSKRTQKISSRTAVRGRKPKPKEYDSDEEDTDEEDELELPPPRGYRSAQPPPPMHAIPPLQHTPMQMGHMGMGGQMGQFGQMGGMGVMPQHGGYGRLPSPRTSPRLAALPQHGGPRMPANMLHSQGPSVYLPASMKRSAPEPAPFGDPYGGAPPPAKRQALDGGRAGAPPSMPAIVPLGPNHPLRNHSPYSGPSAPTSPLSVAPSGLGAAPARGMSASPAPTGSPPGKGKKPELKLFIPNPAAADPPPAPPGGVPGGVEFKVHKDLLSPLELQYVEELNDMDIPLQISLEDEPPLSTSRRAAQDAISMLVNSPSGLGGPLTTSGLGPLSLGPTSLGPFSLNHALPSATGQGEFGELLKWLQTGLTPRSTRGDTPRGGGGAGPSGRTPRGGAAGGSSGASGLPSPGRMTRSMTRGNTPKGNQGGGGGGFQLPPVPVGGGTGRTPRGAQQQQGLPSGTLHDGHRQLLSKLLTTAKSDMEDLLSRLSTPRSPTKGGGGDGGAGPSGTNTLAPPALTSGTRPLTRGSLIQAQAGPSSSQGMPGSVDSRSASGGGGGGGGGLMTGAQAAAALSAALPPLPNGHAPTGPSSGRSTRRSAAAAAGGSALPSPQLPSQPQDQLLGSSQGQQQHPGPAGGLALNSLGGLMSPGWGGPLSSTRSDIFKGLDVLVTPNLAQHELAMLLDVLNADDLPSAR